MVRPPIKTTKQRKRVKFSFDKGERRIKIKVKRSEGRIERVT